MKVDFSTVLLDLNGEPLKRLKKAAVTRFVDGVERVVEPAELLDMTAGFAAIEALMAPDPKDTDGARKLNLFTLGQQIAKGGEQEIEAKDVVLLEEKLASSYAPLVVGRMHELLKG